MSKGSQKTVGVLGGMGPEATMDFFAKVIRRAHAGSDQEHLHLIIDNNPQVPDRNAAVAGAGPSPGPVLAAMAQGLERAGADFLVMVCNAAHAFLKDIEGATSLPLVSIITETRDEALRRLPKAQRVGVLASSGCLDAKLYQNAFAEKGVDVLVPEGEARDSFMTLLYRIKAGDTGAEVTAKMNTLALELVKQGAEALVAGCTEVPLVLTGVLPCPLVNSTDVLVAATLACARGEQP